MKAYITSVNEKTLEMCKWSLERQRFEVIVYQDNTSQRDKLVKIFKDARDEWFLLVDADTIALKTLKPLIDKLILDENIWWWQMKHFCFLRWDEGAGGIQLMNQKVAELARKVGIQNQSKPIHELWLNKELAKPIRRCKTTEEVVSIHGLGQSKEDMERALKIRLSRDKNEWDWELINKMRGFLK